MTVIEVIKAMHQHAASNTPVVVRAKDGRRFLVTDFDFEYDPKGNVSDAFILNIELGS